MLVSAVLVSVGVFVCGFGGSLAHAAAPQTTTCGTSCGGGYTWTHTGPGFSDYNAGTHDVYDCEVEAEGYYCQYIGTDTLNMGGNFKETWSGSSYESGTATLVQDYLAEWFYCSNNGRSNGACWGTYSISPKDTYTDGVTSSGWYHIATGYYWSPYLIGIDGQQAEGYTMPFKNFDYNTISACYEVGVNSYYWWARVCE